MVPANTSRVPGAKLSLRGGSLSGAYQQSVDGTPLNDAACKVTSTFCTFCPQPQGHPQLSPVAHTRTHRIEAVKCSVSILMSTNTYMQGRLVTSTGTRLRRGVDGDGAGDNLG